MSDMTRSDAETIDITDVVKPWLPELRPLPIEPISIDFDGDLLRYKIMFAYDTQPVYFRSRTVPCRCSRWRTRFARFFGRHPRTHRIPSVLVTSI